MASSNNPTPAGAPLKVCANDCALDDGQPYAELAPLCFRFGCAFAEARWGGVLETNNDLAHIIHIEIDRAGSRPQPR
jgi:hypothetical protein